MCSDGQTREKWQLEARGQIEGIGTSPRLSAKDGHGAILAQSNLGRGCAMAAAAIDALASWLRSKYGGAQVLGVGHRVVHGGARFARPAIVTPGSPGRTIRIDSSGAAYISRTTSLAIEAVFERMPGVPQVACFDTSFHQRAFAGRRS